jgi:hypothetical protein
LFSKGILWKKEQYILFVNINQNGKAKEAEIMSVPIFQQNLTDIQIQGWWKSNLALARKRDDKYSGCRWDSFSQQTFRPTCSGEMICHGVLASRKGKSTKKR